MWVICGRALAAASWPAAWGPASEGLVGGPEPRSSLSRVAVSTTGPGPATPRDYLGTGVRISCAATGLGTTGF